jgi:hypothetical protein
MRIAASSWGLPADVRPDIRLSPLSLALLTALLLMALAPLGYVGGGWDDRHYLEAARCAAANGFCLPEDHWARRFTLVVPTGLAAALFGETRQALWLAPAAYSLAAVTFFTLTVQRCYGRRAASISASCSPRCRCFPSACWTLASIPRNSPSSARRPTLCA